MTTSGGREADGLGGTELGERVEDPLTLAAAALGRGDWTGARTAYQRTLEVGESAATLEGLAYACWWLRDDVAKVDFRRRAFRLYLDAGDPVSAARVAISLARDHILQGGTRGDERVGGPCPAPARRRRPGRRVWLAVHCQGAYRAVRRPRPS